MKFIRRLLLNGATRQIIDNIATHTGYPQTSNGLEELVFKTGEIKKAVDSKYINEHDFPIASFGDGETITYKALKLTNSGKRIARSTKKNSQALSQLFWWFMGIISTVIGGLVLAYVFGVGA